VGLHIYEWSDGDPITDGFISQTNRLLYYIRKWILNPIKSHKTGLQGEIYTHLYMIFS